MQQVVAHGPSACGGGPCGPPCRFCPGDRAARLFQCTVGVNFLIAGYAFTSGGLSFDPSLPVQNSHLRTSSAVFGYARVLDLWGMSAKVDALLPYSWLSGTADLAGTPIERRVDGFGDARF